MHLNTLNDIRYLFHHEIDKERWNACLLSSDNPLLYATSSFLDSMCKHWDALILNDYEAIMPLPWNVKWCISYIYSPYFVIAGGVFGKNISPEMLILFIKAIPAKFLYVDLDLNEHNFFTVAIEQNEIHYKTRHNTILDLNSSYEKLFSHYSVLAKRKIKKAYKQHLRLSQTSSAKNIIDLYRQHYYDKDAVFVKYDFTDMINTLENDLAKQTRTYVLSFPNGDVCAFYLLLFDINYVYWLIGGSTNEGKEVGAFYYLTDKVLQDFAGTNRIFRFEGSDNPGILFFNKQFGGSTVFYPRITINRLPWLLRFLK